MDFSTHKFYSGLGEWDRLLHEVTKNAFHWLSKCGQFFSLNQGIEISVLIAFKSNVMFLSPVDRFALQVNTF